MSLKELSKVLLKSSYTYSFIVKGIHIILGFISSILVNRFLGVALRGEYSYIINIISLFVIFGNLGVYQLYPYDKRKELKNIRFLYFNLIIKQFIFYFIISLVSLFLLCRFGYIDYSDLFIWGIGILFVLFNILGNQLSMIVSVEDFIYKSKVIIRAELFKFILLIFVYILSGRNLLIILSLDIIYELLIVILCIYRLKIKVNLKYHNFEFFKRTIKKGFLPMLFTLLLSLNYRIDILFLKWSNLVSMSDVGLYAVGVQLASYVWVFPDIFKEVLYSKTATSDSVRDIKYSIKFSLFVESIFLLVIIVLGRPLLYFLYGSDYMGAVSVTKIIFIGVLSMSLFKLLTPLYNARGEFFKNFLILLTSVGVNIIFNFILIPKYGILGAAVASVFGYSICGIVYIFRFKKDYDIRIVDLIFIKKTDLMQLKRMMQNRFQGSQKD